MSTLFFIRHGQASFGRSHYDQLSPRGYDQARHLADHLAQGPPFDRIYTGTLERQTETARMLTDRYREKGLHVPEVCPLDALNEYDAKAVCRALIPELIEQDSDFKQQVDVMLEDTRVFQSVFETVIRRWVQGGYKAAGFGRWETFKSRVNGAIDKILARDGHGKQVAVFTSGGPVSVAVQRALALSDEVCLKVSWQVVNASITRFKCTRTRFMLATFNEYGFLEQAGREMVTYR